MYSCSFGPFFHVLPYQQCRHSAAENMHTKFSTSMPQCMAADAAACTDGRVVGVPPPLTQANTAVHQGASAVRGVHARAAPTTPAMRSPRRPAPPSWLGLGGTEHTQL
eukprot:SAG22_NODE_2014_length_3140_cov_2.829990_2_plen_108_part_00